MTGLRRTTLSALGMCAMLAGCGGSSSVPDSLTPGGAASQSFSPPTNDGPGPAADGDCSTNCAIGDDGMLYRVVSTRRFTDAEGVTVAGLQLSLTDTSGLGHDWEPTDGTYPITSAGQRLGGLDDPSLSTSETGDPRCWTDPIRHPSASGGDAETYHVAGNASLTLPKEICFAIPTGTTIVAVDLIDQDASYDAEVKLSTPV